MKNLSRHGIRGHFLTRFGTYGFISNSFDSVSYANTSSEIKDSIKQMKFKPGPDHFCSPDLLFGKFETISNKLKSGNLVANYFKPAIQKCHVISSEENISFYIYGRCPDTFSCKIPGKKWILTFCSPLALLRNWESRFAQG